MRLARVTAPVEEAAKRLRTLSLQRTSHGQDGLPVALSGGFGKSILSQSHEDVVTLVEAVLGRPPTMTELKDTLLRGGDAA